MKSDCFHLNLDSETPQHLNISHILRRNVMFFTIAIWFLFMCASCRSAVSSFWLLNVRHPVILVQLNSSKYDLACDTAAFALKVSSARKACVMTLTWTTTFQPNNDTDGLSFQDATKMTFIATLNTWEWGAWEKIIWTVILPWSFIRIPFDDAACTACSTRVHCQVSICICSGFECHLQLFQRKSCAKLSIDGGGDLQCSRLWPNYCGCGLLFFFFFCLLMLRNCFLDFCFWTLIWVSRHWAWLRWGYWRYKSLIDWLIDWFSLQ